MLLLLPVLILLLVVRRVLLLDSLDYDNEYVTLLSMKPSLRANQNHATARP